MKNKSALAYVTSAVLALMLAAALGSYLIQADREAGRRLHQDFTARATVAASLTSNAFYASLENNVGGASHLLGGDARQVQAALETDPVLQNGMVLTADGAVLGAYPAYLSGTDFRRAVQPLADKALLTSNLAFTDLLPTPSGNQFFFGVPYMVDKERRVWIASVPLAALNQLISGLLAASVGVNGARAYLIDANDGIIARTADEELARSLPDTGVRDAARDISSGVRGSGYFTTVSVPQTTWRVLFIAPDAQLLAPVQSSRRSAWAMFGAFLVALLAILALCAAAQQSTSRLAHARQHDPLTGLPNRSLFESQIDKALANRRPGTGEVAVLFIDLNGFKPINDMYGHNVGDALLVATAKKLGSAIRTHDLVARFGGDEFLILSTGLNTAADAEAVAARIRQAVAEPVQIGTHTVAVSCSVGVAVTNSDVSNAETLIHSADLAMYRAKEAHKQDASHTPIATASA